MTRVIVNNDSITPFYFEKADARGAFVKLGNSFVEALNGHDYPATIRILLGQCISACTLMNTHVKQPTRLSLQASGDGLVSLLMAESILTLPTNERLPEDTQSVHQTVRGFSRHDASIPANAHLTSLEDILGKAHLAITLEPETGQRYQGIVDLRGQQLEQCLKDYFQQSEQLATSFRLAVSEEFACGIMIQQLPASEANSHENFAALWEELDILTQSVKDEELLELPGKTILHRLFHQQALRMGPGQPVVFACACSAERTGAALLQVSQSEIDTILEEDGEIVMDCEFCSARYRFDVPAINALRHAQQPTRH